MLPNAQMVNEGDEAQDLVGIYDGRAGRLHCQPGEADAEEKMMQALVAEGIHDTEQDEGGAGDTGGDDCQQRDDLEGLGGFVVLFIFFIWLGEVCVGMGVRIRIGIGGVVIIVILVVLMASGNGGRFRRASDQGEAGFVTDNVHRRDGKGEPHGGDGGAHEK